MASSTLTARGIGRNWETSRAANRGSCHGSDSSLRDACRCGIGLSGSLHYSRDHSIKVSPSLRRVLLLQSFPFILLFGIVRIGVLVLLYSEAKKPQILI